MVYFGEFEGRFAIFISIIVIFLDKLSHNRGSGLLINRLIRYSHGIKRILSLICNFLLSYHQEKPEELKSCEVSESDYGSDYVSEHSRASKSRGSYSNGL